MSLNRKLRNQYFWRLKKIKLQLMQNRESFQTLDILFYFVFRITVNCGITAVNLNWKAFLIMHAWSVLDYRIHEDRRHFLIRFLSLQQSIHPSIYPSIQQTFTKTLLYLCHCPNGTQGWGHSSSLQNVTVYLRTFIYATHSDRLKL